MLEKPANLVEFRHISALQLWSNAEQVWSAFVQGRQELLQIFRKEDGEFRSYRLVYSAGKFIAESDAQKATGHGPQRIVDINLGPFYICKPDLQELERTYQTFVDHQTILECKKAERFMPTNIVPVRPRLQNEWKPTRLLKNFCDDIAYGITNIATATNTKYTINRLELKVNTQGGALIIRGQTPIPDPHQYVSAFDEFSLLAAEMEIQYPFLQTFPFDSAMAEPEIDFTEYYRRCLQLVLPPRDIRHSGTSEKAYEPFMRIHSDVYYQVKKHKDWHTAKNLSIDDTLDFLTGDTYEICFDERIIKSSIANWTIAIAAIL